MTSTPFLLGKLIWHLLSIPSGQIELAPFVYTILMGVIFMIIGLVVYEKRAEI